MGRPPLEKTKQSITFRWDADLIAWIKSESLKAQRNPNNYMETMLLNIKNGKVQLISD